MERPISYRVKTLKELLECYAHERGRENREDAEITQKYIMDEIIARIKDTFAFLDYGVDVEEVYKKLLER